MSPGRSDCRQASLSGRPRLPWCYRCFRVAIDDNCIPGSPSRVGASTALPPTLLETSDSTAGSDPMVCRELIPTNDRPGDDGMGKNGPIALLSADWGKWLGPAASARGWRRAKPYISADSKWRASGRGLGSNSPHAWAVLHGLGQTALRNGISGSLEPEFRRSPHSWRRISTYASTVRVTGVGYQSRSGGTSASPARKDVSEAIRAGSVAYAMFHVEHHRPAGATSYPRALLKVQCSTWNITFLR